jgi:hypothetical protein
VIPNADFVLVSHQNERPLPVLRVGFDDAAESWFNIDLGNSDIHGSADNNPHESPAGCGISCASKEADGKGWPESTVRIERGPECLGVRASERQRSFWTNRPPGPSK